MNSLTAVIKPCIQLIKETTDAEICLKAAFDD